MTPIEKIEKVKKAVIAYRAALEFDYCPNPKKTNEVFKISSYKKADIKSALEEHEGRRPDEIAGTICALVDNL